MSRKKTAENFRRFLFSRGLGTRACQDRAGCRTRIGEAKRAVVVDRTRLFKYGWFPVDHEFVDSGVVDTVASREELNYYAGE